jgi:hypothetical protein
MTKTDRRGFLGRMGLAVAAALALPAVKTVAAAAPVEAIAEPAPRYYVTAEQPDGSVMLSMTDEPVVYRGGSFRAESSPYDTNHQHTVWNGDSRYMPNGTFAAVSHQHTVWPGHTHAGGTLATSGHDHSRAYLDDAMEQVQRGSRELYARAQALQDEFDRAFFAGSDSTDSMVGLRNRLTGAQPGRGGPLTVAKLDALLDALPAPSAYTEWRAVPGQGLVRG